MKSWLFLPRHIIYLLKVYASLLLGLTAFRVIAVLIRISSFKNVEASLLAQSFVIGLQFDHVIIAATLLIPFLLLSVCYFVHQSARSVRIVHWWLVIFTSIIVLLQCIDLLYFDHFSIRITHVILNWIQDLGFVVQMVGQDPLYLAAILPIPFIVYFVSQLFSRFRWQYISSFPERTQKRWGFGFVILLALLFIGVRGRIAIKSPIREGTAFFSSNADANYLALNPTYSFFSSWVRASKYKQKPLSYMPKEKALALVPSLKRVRNFPHRTKLAPNIILVIMEGMSAHYGAPYKSPSWTPTLDRLAQEGVSFKNAWSAGVHTFNGVYSSLYSWPAPSNVHPLKRDQIPALKSLPEQLKNSGHQTIFFTTHDDQFDNMAGFVLFNGFEKVISQRDYPTEQVLSILGVPDHYMFNYAIPVLQQAAQSQKPFFAAILTGSNHKPHVIPPELASQFNNPNEKESIVRYADWAIGHFLKEAQRHSWFSNSIFVFVADHGQSVGDDIILRSLAYNHSPLIFWGPALKHKPQVISTPASQMDAMPTIMGLAQVNHVNATLGIDLFHEKRDFAIFATDDHLALITEHLYLKDYANGKTQIMIKEGDEWISSSLTSEIKEQYLLPARAQIQLADEFIRTGKIP